MKLNLPNKITLARIALIPVVAILYLVNFPYHEIAACIAFIVCCCTDFIDGNIARKRNLVTDLGKFLDPIADKVIVVPIYISNKYFTVPSIFDIYFSRTFGSAI